MRESVSDHMNDLSRLEVRQEGAAYEYRCLVCSVVERRPSSVGSLCRRRGSRDRTWWMIRTPRTRTQPCTILPSTPQKMWATTKEEAMQQAMCKKRIINSYSTWEFIWGQFPVATHPSKSGTAEESCSLNQCEYVLQRSPVITRIMVI